MTDLPTILSEADERFDQKFLGHKSDQILDGHYGIIVSNENSIANVKDFLHSEIKRAVEETVKRIKDSLPKTLEPNTIAMLDTNNGGHMYELGRHDYSVLVNDLLSTLTSSNNDKA